MHQTITAQLSEEKNRSLDLKSHHKSYWRAQLLVKNNQQVRTERTFLSALCSVTSSASEADNELNKPIQNVFSHNMLPAPNERFFSELKSHIIFYDTTNSE